MEELKKALITAFEEADNLHQGGNSKMGMLKLKLKEAAAFVSPELTNYFHGKIGVGATTTAPIGRNSFAWTGDMPGAGKGRGKKPAAAQRVVADKQPGEVDTNTKGNLSEEGDNTLFSKIAAMKPVEIAETYTIDVLDTLAATLEVTRDENWSLTKYAAEIRKAAKSKIAE
jgi:hypothetical protein